MFNLTWVPHIFSESKHIFKINSIDKPIGLFLYDKNMGFNLLRAIPTKWSNTQTIRQQQPTNCLIVFGHFVGLTHKG